MHLFAYIFDLLAPCFDLGGNNFDLLVKATDNKIKVKKDKKSKDGDMAEYLVQILDKNGSIRKSVESNTMEVNIPTKDLEPGTYFLHLTLGEERYKQQLII
ncbi:MAG: T9SS type A sorting domain-containing protein, partial [Bacteroidota bacterium]